MSRLIFDTSSFCAFVYYQENRKELIVTFRNGKQYLYPEVSKTKFRFLKNARNKGQWLREYFIERRKCIYLKTIPVSEVNKIVSLKYNWQHRLAN